MRMFHDVSSIDVNMIKYVSGVCFGCFLVFCKEIARYS